MLAHALTTVPATIAFLSTDVEPSVVEAFIDAATTRIENYCDNGFVQRTFTEYHTGGINQHTLGGAKRLFLSRSPIVSVSSVTDQDDTPTAIAATSYRIAPDLNALEHISTWPAPVGRWIVIYTAGAFATTADVTADLQLAVHFLVADWLGDPQRPVLSTSTGTRSQNYVTGGMSERVTKIIEPYVRHHV